MESSTIKKQYVPVEHVNPENPNSVDATKPRHIVFAKGLRFNFPSRDEEIADTIVSEIESYVTEQELFMPVMNIPDGAEFQPKLMGKNGIVFRNWWRDRPSQPRAVLIWDASLPDGNELVVYVPHSDSSVLPFVNSSSTSQTNSDESPSTSTNPNRSGDVPRPGYSEK